MPGIVETVVEYLGEQGWIHDQEPGRTVIRPGLRGDNGAYPMFFMADDEGSALALIMSSGAGVPEGRSGAVSECMTRINWLLDHGSLQNDFEDGDVIIPFSHWDGGEILGVRVGEASCDGSRNPCYLSSGARTSQRGMAGGRGRDVRLVTGQSCMAEPTVPDDPTRLACGTCRVPPPGPHPSPGDPGNANPRTGCVFTGCHEFEVQHESGRRRYGYHCGSFTRSG